MGYKRSAGRSFDQMREVKITPGFTRYAEGSVLIEMGATRVICTASIDDRVPMFKRGRGEGWVTAEYSMLPRATETRTQREAGRAQLSGRTQEIQRLIGRSLRAVVQTNRLGERTVYLDCDVLDADGGTRCAAITGAYVALKLALDKLVERGTVARLPLRSSVAAVSCGIVGGVPVLDLDYREDSSAEVDMNVVMTGADDLVEVQATGEGVAFSREELDRLLDLAASGIAALRRAQNEVAGTLQV